MTGKRFILTETNYIYDNQDKGICPTLESVVKVLNELHEENQLLLKASEKDSELIKNLRKGIHRWKKDNEQLRFDFKEMKGLLHSLEDEIEKLEKENKRLQRCINEIYTIARLEE